MNNETNKPSINTKNNNSDVPSLTDFSVSTKIMFRLKKRLTANALKKANFFIQIPFCNK